MKEPTPAKEPPYRPWRCAALLVVTLLAVLMAGIFLLADFAVGYVFLFSSICTARFALQESGWERLQHALFPPPPPEPPAGETPVQRTWRAFKKEQQDQEQ